MTQVQAADLETGEIALLGRVMPASNATFVGEIDGLRVVYKPIRGERPLWDFPDGTLADREVAAHLVSVALGWQVVPPTVLRDGPHGPGMVQAWMDPVEDIEAVDLVGVGEIPEGLLHVLDAVDGDDQPVALVHEDHPALRRMAIFDALINNGDRKGGHIIPRADGHRYGVDHGVAFHVDNKLRTVLWGWAGKPFDDDELATMDRVVRDVALLEALHDHLTVVEVQAFVRRGERLVEVGHFPEPSPNWPSIPWPAF